MSKIARQDTSKKLVTDCIPIRNRNPDAVSSNTVERRYGSRDKERKTARENERPRNIRSGHTLTREDGLGRISPVSSSDDREFRPFDICFVTMPMRNVGITWSHLDPS